MFVKNEGFITVKPTAKFCQTCKNALPDVKVKGVIYSKKESSVCRKYDFKPSSVLWENAECKDYEKVGS